MVTGSVGAKALSFELQRTGKMQRFWPTAEWSGSDRSRLETQPVNRLQIQLQLSAMTGPNLDSHDNPKGGDLPSCTRPVKVHQIAAEFILPTEMLER